MVARPLLILLVLIASAVNCAHAGSDTRFRSIKVTNADLFDAPPILRMGTDDRLIITFDEIGEQPSYLQYRLLHCNADWQPSALIESEYLEGFNSVDIEDFAFSTATFIHYVNYRIEIPDPQSRLRILHSGNYILQVYDPLDPDEILLQTRFRVSQNAAAIAGRYDARTDRGFNDEWQQLYLSATVDLSTGANPYNDFKMQVLQNDVASSMREIPSPQRVNGNKLIYEHLPQLIFPAGNEYHRFESVSNSFPGMNVDSLYYLGGNYHVWLKPDVPMAEREYRYDQTQHGRFLVREYNASDSDIAADYITVHFLLEMDENEDWEIYVDGEMTGGKLDSRNRMTYDSVAGAYTLQLPLKQGAYNYRYLVRYKDGSIHPLDGNKWETGNQYTMLLWHRPPGSRADMLIGAETIQ